MQTDKSPKWVFDIDGVITTNPSVIAWLTYHLRYSNQKVIVLTGRNPSRKEETLEFLDKASVYYDEIIFMEEDDPRGFANIAKWKVNQLTILNPLIWIDDNIKEYKSLIPVEMANLRCITLDI